MKIAIATEEAFHYAKTPADAVRCFQGTGFRYIDYTFSGNHLEGSPFMKEDEKEWKQIIHDAGEAAAECNFQFVQAHASNYNPMGTAGDHQACLRAMNRNVEACGILGISAIVVHTSISPQHLYPMDKDAYFQYNREFLRGMLKTAEKYGTYICIENSTVKNMGPQYYFRTPEEMLEFVEFCGHPLLKCCWDTGHAVLEGKGNQYEDITKLGDQLKAIHLHDNGGQSDQHIAPYCGCLQMDSVVQALKDIKYTGYFTYETAFFMDKINGTGPLSKLPLELRQDAWRLLYKIAKLALETYGIYEE